MGAQPQLEKTVTLPYSYISRHDRCNVSHHAPPYYDSGPQWYQFQPCLDISIWANSEFVRVRF